MNPKDFDENKIIIDTMYKNMPLHTDENFKIKHSFDQNIPKNLMEYSEKINKEYLDDNLAIIEELHHRDNNNKLVSWFRNYQNKIYDKKNTSIHDNFLKIKNFIKNYDKTSVLTCGFIINPYIFSVSCTHGAELTTGDTSSHTTGWSEQIAGAKVSATANRCYDRIACNIFSAAGNQRLGVYDNGGGGGDTATNLLIETTSHTAVTGFNWKNVTEFTIPDTIEWIVQNSDSASIDIYYGSTGTREGLNPYVYTTFLNPLVGETYASNYIINYKIGHS